MERPDRDDLRRRLTIVEERIDRILGRLTAGYGTESDRDGWQRWLQQLRAQRDDLRAALGGPDPEPPAA